MVLPLWDYFKRNSRLKKMTEQESIDIVHLRLCYGLAKASPDRSNQNGALLLRGDQIISTGRNDFPIGLEVTEDMITDRDKKLFYIEHAERTAIYNAAAVGERTRETIMYCPWFACDSCARAIILSGISKVIGHKQRMDMTPDRWKASVEAGLQMLRDCGVEMEFYDGPIGACEPIIINGEKWQP